MNNARENAYKEFDRAFEQSATIYVQAKLVTGRTSVNIQEIATGDNGFWSKWSRRDVMERYVNVLAAALKKNAEKAKAELLAGFDDVAE